MADGTTSLVTPGSAGYERQLAQLKEAEKRFDQELSRLRQKWADEHGGQIAAAMMATIIGRLAGHVLADSAMATSVSGAGDMFLNSIPIHASHVAEVGFTHLRMQPSPEQGMQ